MDMFGKDNYFYHGSIRRYIVIFGSLFNDMYIKRKNESGNREEMIKVPLRFGKGNIYEKVEQDSESRETKKIRQIVPVMTFRMSDFTRDDSRKTNKWQKLKHTQTNGDGTINYQLNRIPYNFTFELALRTKNEDDALQIVEQITSVFNPSINVIMSDISGLEIDSEQTINIQLDDVQPDDNFEDYEESRHIEWTLNFTLKGYIYCRTQEAYVIKEVSLIGSFAEDMSLENTFDMGGAFERSNSLVDAVDQQYKEVQKNLFDGLSVDTVDSKTTNKKVSKRKPKS